MSEAGDNEREPTAEELLIAIDISGGKVRALESAMRKARAISLFWNITSAVVVMLSVGAGILLFAPMQSNGSYLLLSDSERVFVATAMIGLLCLTVYGLEMSLTWRNLSAEAGIAAEALEGAMASAKSTLSGKSAMGSKSSLRSSSVLTRASATLHADGPVPKRQR